MPPWFEWLGYAAAACTTGAFLPQAWLTFRTRDVSGVSLGMYAVFTVGVALWLLYGLAMRMWPVVVRRRAAPSRTAPPRGQERSDWGAPSSNAVTLLLAAGIPGMKILFEAKRRP
jgi:MtN3 and saliva related transmembrane protein